MRAGCVTLGIKVPLKSLQAVVSKELGAEQAKLQKQVLSCAARQQTTVTDVVVVVPPQAYANLTYIRLCVAQVEYWQTQASKLQQQLDDAGDIQGQLQELRQMKEQRDATPELGALTEPATAAEHVMMLKRQQQVTSPLYCHKT